MTDSYLLGGLGDYLFICVRCCHYFASFEFLHQLFEAEDFEILFDVNPNAQYTQLRA